jgi:arylsulfatase A-like enzyme
MKSLLTFTIVAAGWLLLTGASALAADQPNIVYILSDDQGWEDVSFHHGEIKTPNIDKIAAAGARLEQFYVQPVCSPTRGSLMTGRYPMRYGLQVGVVRPWAQYGLPLEERTLAQALKEVGYETAICGKWHLGHFQPAYLPTHRGFDHEYGHYNGAIDYFTHIRDGGLDWHRDDKALKEEGYSTALVGKEACRLIAEHDTKKPLFLYVPFNAVHSPFMVPDSYKQPYPNLKGQRQTYAGMVAAMDEAIGTILSAIDAKGIRPNTLIVFNSDNGGPSPGKITSNGPYRAGKGTLYEGGVRVCAAAAWDGHIPAGSVYNGMMHMTDWYPTLINLAGGSLQQSLPLDGKDQWASITQGKPSPRTEVLHNSTPFSGAIRMGDWKLVLNGSHTEIDSEGSLEESKAGKKKAAAETIELFNIAADPYEKTNLAAKEPAKVKELHDRYKELASQAAPPHNEPAAKGFKSPAVWGIAD